MGYDVSMGREITFTDVTNSVPEEFYPCPAIQAMPEWWKSLQPYESGRGIAFKDSESSNQTAKRCIPMLDAIGAGYTIFATEDIYISQNLAGDKIGMAKSGLGIGYHSQQQVSTHPNFPEGQSPMKWNNPFSIKTPPGYSCLFVPVLNGDPLPFKFFSGVVDTDTYWNPVNFPFELNPYDFTGIVEAGSPLIQVIPFKREDWKINIKTGMTDELEKNIRKFRTYMYAAYRNVFWSRKKYS